MRIFMTNKWFYTFVLGIVFLFTFVSVFAVYSFLPNPGHGANSVWISVEGQELTLQSAIDQGLIHSPDDVQRPITCVGDELLVYNRTGTNNWECMNFVQYEKGQWCGFFTNQNSYSNTVECEFEGESYNPDNGCPYGFSQIYFGSRYDGHDNRYRYSVSCIKE